MRENIGRMSKAFNVYIMALNFVTTYCNLTKGPYKLV